MIVTRKIEFDMGHRVPNHKSKCRNPHGHRYVAEVGVDDKVIIEKGASDEGMVIDFSDLKEIMMNKIDGVCDHAFMISRDDIDMINCFFHSENDISTLNLIDEEIRQYGYAHAFGAQRNSDKDWKTIIVPFIPTAENIAWWIYVRMEHALKEKDIKLKYVRIWETPNCSAIYSGEDKKIITTLGGGVSLA